MTSAAQRAQRLLSAHLSEGELNDWERRGRVVVPSSCVPGVMLEIEACDSYVILLEGTVPTKARVRVRWPLYAPPAKSREGRWWIDLVDRVPGTVGQRRALRAFVHPGVVFDLCLWFVGQPMPQADEVLGYRLGLEANEEALWRAGLTHWEWIPAALPCDLPVQMQPEITEDRSVEVPDRRFFDWARGGTTYLDREGNREAEWVSAQTISHLASQGLSKDEVAVAVGMTDRIDLHWKAAARVRTGSSRAFSSPLASVADED